MTILAKFERITTAPPYISSSIEFKQDLFVVTEKSTENTQAMTKAFFNALRAQKDIQQLSDEMVSFIIVLLFWTGVFSTDYLQLLSRK